MKGTRNRFPSCLGCCTITVQRLYHMEQPCCFGKELKAVLHAPACPMAAPRLPHTCSSQPCPEQLNPTMSGQRCAGRDSCCSSPSRSLPWYTPGKRAITPLSEICVESLWTPCLHFRVWLQSFRAIWPCTGNKCKTMQKPASDEGLGLVPGPAKLVLPGCLCPLFRKEEITLDMGLCSREIYTFLFSFVYFFFFFTYTKFIPTRVVNTQSFPCSFSLLMWKAFRNSVFELQILTEQCFNLSFNRPCYHYY